MPPNIAEPPMPVDVEVDNVEPQPLSRETNRLLLLALEGALQDVMACVATVVEDDTKQRVELCVPPSTPTSDRSTMKEPLKNPGEQRDITSCGGPRDH
jgi:hypothetical protein